MNAKLVFVMPALAAVFWLVDGRLAAQTQTNIYNFSAATRITAPSGPVNTNSDGNQITDGLTLSGSTLYGEAAEGGVNGCGTVWAVNTNGGGFGTVHVFSALSASPFTNADGAFPTECSPIVSGSTVYGMTTFGGTFGYGTLFSVATGGTNFAVLRTFNNVTTNGASPEAGLAISGSTIFGTTVRGGQFNNGTVFSINTNGSNFTILHNFTNTGTTFDGEDPYAGVTVAGNMLYGTTETGGSNSYGTLFALNTNGSGFTVLHHFANTTTNGSDSQAPLVVADGMLYGTTYGGGAGTNGTVFAIGTNGLGFTILHSFTGLVPPLYTNSDGGEPEAGLVLSGGMLYGTASIGGPYDNGTVFAIGTNGGGFAVLHSFAGISVSPADGAGPVAGMVSAGNTFYGTAQQGANNSGLVFALTVPVPQLALRRTGTNVVAQWPTNASAFTLQSTTNLASPEVWTNVSTTPVIVNGQLTVTNSASSKQMFYRLNL